jgi:hypothetical protein
MTIRARRVHLFVTVARSPHSYFKLVCSSLSYLEDIDWPMSVAQIALQLLQTDVLAEL